MKTAIILAVAFLSGCATPSELLVNPQGRVMRCSAAGWGLIGAPLAYQSFDRCVADLERLGYKTVAARPIKNGPDAP